ncbi:hypothetical protein CEXT_473711, partial [Caerostris extrusa]
DEKHLWPYREVPSGLLRPLKVALKCLHAKNPTDSEEELKQFGFFIEKMVQLANQETDKPACMARRPTQVQKNLKIYKLNRFAVPDL